MKLNKSVIAGLGFVWLAMMFVCDSLFAQTGDTTKQKNGAVQFLQLGGKKPNPKNLRFVIIRRR